MGDLLSDNSFHTVVGILVAIVMLALLKRISSFFAVVVGTGAVLLGVLFLIMILSFAGVDRFQIPIDAPI